MLTPSYFQMWQSQVVTQWFCRAVRWMLYTTHIQNGCYNAQYPQSRETHRSDGQQVRLWPRKSCAALPLVSHYLHGFINFSNR